MRPRALVFLLAATGGDYLLWNWSIADSHDVLSLVAGLTLLPLVAVSAGVLAVAGARGFTFALELLSGRAHAPRRFKHRSDPAPARTCTTAHPSSPSNPAEHRPASRRLAA